MPRCCVVGSAEAPGSGVRRNRVIRRLVQALCVAVCGIGLAACGDPVPGGQRAAATSELCANDFQTCVMPVLSGQIRRRGGSPISCSDGNCHAPGGVGGRFTLGSDNTANQAAVSSFVNFTSPHDSLVLVEPVQDDLSPSAVAALHGGGEIFPSRNDACYLAIYNWINNQVVNQTSAACGLCAPVANTFTSCGYP